MNKRERFVVLFLTATFLAGAGLSIYRRVELRRRLASSPTAVENPADSAVAVAALPVCLNSARQYELEALPGIGPVIAQRIIQFRDRQGGFKSVEQLRRVSGIGPKRFAALAGLVTVAPESGAARQPGATGQQQ